MQLTNTKALLRKEAGDTPVLSHLFKDFALPVGKKLVETTFDYAKMIPLAAGLTGGIGLAYLLSPRGVAENASDLSINAMEKASLAESLRDYEALKATNKLRKKVRKAIHDQFV